MKWASFAFLLAQVQPARSKAFTWAAPLARGRSLCPMARLEGDADDATRPLGVERRHVEVDGPEVVFHPCGNNALHGVDEILQRLFLGLALSHRAGNVDALGDEPAVQLIGLDLHAEFPRACVGDGGCLLLNLAGVL